MEVDQMESLTLIRPVLIKAVVTEGYKKRARKELQQAIHQTNMELQRLDYQEKVLITELEKKNPEGIPQAKQHLGRERQRLEENRGALLLRMKEIEEMALDGEVVYGKMESPLEIRVGDRWQDVLGVEIILLDGVIVEIRRTEPG
jgi:hypothetical protein